MPLYVKKKAAYHKVLLIHVVFLWMEFKICLLYGYIFSTA